MLRNIQLYCYLSELLDKTKPAGFVNLHFCDKDVAGTGMVACLQNNSTPPCKKHLAAREDELCFYPLANATFLLGVSSSFRLKNLTVQSSANTDDLSLCKCVIFGKLAMNLLTVLEDLKKIINESARGDVRAQEKLYRRFAPKMFGVCLRYSADANEAEDNLQEGFVKVFSNIKRFRHEGSFEGWVRRIMVNVSLEKFRKQKRMFSVEDVAIFEKEPVANDIISAISAQELIALIQSLTPRYRMVFNLFVMEGYSHEEISREMGISVGTSKSNLARAKSVLQGKIKLLYRELEKNITV